MGDFESNPDIDETPPISLRDSLEKMKPFLMAYEGIKDQEEWEVKRDLPCFCFCHIAFCYINHLLYLCCLNYVKESSYRSIKFC